MCSRKIYNNSSKCRARWPRTLTFFLSSLRTIHHFHYFYYNVRKMKPKLFSERTKVTFMFEINTDWNGFGILAYGIANTNTHTPRKEPTYRLTHQPAGPVPKSVPSFIAERIGTLLPHAFIFPALREKIRSLVQQSDPFLFK